jgi:glutamine amidotransferase PdxT
MNRMDDAQRVYEKISTAVEGEALTTIIGACAGIIVNATVEGAPDAATALRAFDAAMALTRNELMKQLAEDFKRGTDDED